MEFHMLLHWIFLKASEAGHENPQFTDEETGT